MENKTYYIEGLNGQKFEASEYQAKIFENIEHGYGNMIINAAAGSSKTTTIVNAIKYIPEDKRILFVAFNTSTRDNIKNVVTRKRTKITTFNGLGYGILIENGIVDKENKEAINENKYPNYIRENFEKLITDEEYLDDKEDTIKTLIELVNKSRYYMAFTDKQIKKVGSIYNIYVDVALSTAVREVLKWGKEQNFIDYDDMIWMVNFLNLPAKSNQFDWIFIDEAQDTSIAKQRLIEKCFKRGTRFAAVCDGFQQINVWCGATEKAIDNLKSIPNTKEYKLPISYRCPKKIVDLASRYSDNIIAAPNAKEGEIIEDVSISDPKGGDLVLCRKTAPIIELFMQYLSEGKNVHIKGGKDFTKEYNRLTSGIKAKTIDIALKTKTGLFPTLYKNLFKEIDKLIKTNTMSEEEAFESDEIQEMIDNITALEILSEGLKTIDQLKERVKAIFEAKEENNAIELSTIHKAKGLEADNVYILKPSLLGPRKNDEDWKVKEENNLIYVAYTRAKSTLNFIKEKKKENNKKITKTIADLKKIRQKLLV